MFNIEEFKLSLLCKSTTADGARPFISIAVNTSAGEQRSPALITHYELISLAPVYHALSRLAAAYALVAELLLPEGYAA